MSKKKKKFSGLVIYGPTLAEYRERVGLTQDDLATELGVTRVTVTGWEGQVAVKIDQEQEKRLKTLLKLDDLNVLTNVPHGTSQYILDHPFIKAMADQSKYIMGRVLDLEQENKKLRGNKDMD